MSNMERTIEVLAEEVDDGIFTRGAQLAVMVGGETRLSIAFGDSGTGTPATPGTLMRVYCTIKPLASIAIARQVDARRLDLDEPLADRLPNVQALADGRVTLRHVLTHTAGLHRPMGIELELIAPDKRDALLESVPRPPGWRLGHQAAYSEVFGWHLLGRLLEVTTGEPIGNHLRAAVIEPLGLTDTWIGMTPEEHTQLLPRIGVNWDLRTLRPYPLLLERGARMCTEVNPAHGGYTTADDLARFYAALLAQLGDGATDALPSPETLRVFTRPQGSARFDEVLDRECEYGLGFMTGLAGHAFGRWCSPSSFGHSGNTGTSFAFADPEHNLAVGAIFNGLVDHESAFLRRPALVRAIYEDLDAADEALRPPPEAPASRRRFRLRR